MQAFDTFPNLLYFARRGNGTLTERGVDESTAWIMDRSDEASTALGLLPAPVKPLLDDVLEDSSTQQMNDDWSMRWYDRVLRETRILNDLG
jgi:hypothetical protein